MTVVVVRVALKRFQSVGRELCITVLKTVKNAEEIVFFVLILIHIQLYLPYQD